MVIALKLDDPEKVEYCFWIKSNKRNILKFAANIGFRLNSDKLMNLANTCKILENTLRPIIGNAEVFKLRNEGLSIRQIARELKVGKDRVHRIIQDI